MAAAADSSLHLFICSSLPSSLPSSLHLFIYFNAAATLWSSSEFRLPTNVVFITAAVIVVVASYMSYECSGIRCR
eukprot:gene10326-2467_t